MPPFLTGFWYVALPGGELKKSRMQKVTLLGQQLLLGRGETGEVFALRDFCPHRGIPLSYGSFDGSEIECCYHGWRFNMQGICTAIPSLTDNTATDISKIKCAKYHTQEAHGVIWVYMPAQSEPPPHLLSYPLKPSQNFIHVDSVVFPCNLDHAVIGLMDPSHGPFVHKSWWWRSKRSMHAKQKKFAPTSHGFKMVSHKPSSNSRAYKILGASERKTEISFQLPGLRCEHIQAGNKNVVLLTALTPITETSTMLHQFMFTDISVLNALVPVLKPFGKRFIGQDLDIVRKQQEGLSGDHPQLLLLGDADAQARWYYRLKKEWQDAQSENRPFENRIKERTLKWRS